MQQKKPLQGEKNGCKRKKEIYIYQWWILCALVLKNFNTCVEINSSIDLISNFQRKKFTHGLLCNVGVM